MNDVLNTQGYTQFSGWNRIPESAWALLLAVALFAHVLVGCGAERSRRASLLLWVLPVIVAVSLLLISDMDSPRGGVIRVRPVDLVSLEGGVGR